jgi:hypothetical protein
LPPAAVDVPAFVGLAERGPLTSPTVIEGWPGFVTAFGGLLDNAQLGWTVRAFFENGGRRCHVVRVAAPVVTTTSKAGPQPADRLSSLVTDALGFVAGAAVWITQTVATVSAGAQPADRRSSVLAMTDGFAPGVRVAVSQANQPTVWRTIIAFDPAVKRLGWDTSLPPGFDLTSPIGFTAQHQTMRLLANVSPGVLGWTRALPSEFALNVQITFASGAAPASGCLFDDMGEPVLRVTAASPGAYGDAIEVRLTRTVCADARTRPVSPPDPADTLSVDGLASLVQGATLTVRQEGAPPLRRRVKAILTGSRQVVLNQALPGTYDLGAAADGSKPILLRREAFALSVLEQGKLIETHVALDLPVLAGDEITELAHNSALIRATRLAVASDYPLPDPASGPGLPGRLTLAGGRDGIASLGIDELTAGLGVLEPVDEPAAVAIPDAQPNPTRALEKLPQPAPLVDPCALCPPPAVSVAEPPAQIVEASPTIDLNSLRLIQQAMIQHCELRGDRIALLDAPRDLSQPDPFNPDALREWRIGLDSRFAALYWPWLWVLDPSNPRAEPRELPPCGHVLGDWARSDVTSGVQKAPANTPLDWVQWVTREADDVRRGMLNDDGLNVIRVLPNRGIRIYGARVMTPEPDYRLLNVRRVLIQLRRALLHGLAWTPFEPDNIALRARLRACIEGLLTDIWQRGGLAGGVATDAFAVSFDPPESAGDGTLVINIAVAPVAPAEFVYLTLLRANDAITAVEPTTIAAGAT